METPKIKELPEADRPREKLTHRGAGALSDAELLAIFLRTGIRGRSAVAVGADLIRAAGGSLDRLAGLGPKELCRLAKGIGPAKACELAAAFEVGKRVARQASHREPMASPERVHEFMGPLLQNLQRESLRVVLLDTRHHLLHEEEVSLGTINESLAHPREILRPAISHGAYAFILVHNHPSGDPSPSEADRALTRRMRDAADLVQIHLLDHVIIGRERPGAPPYFSFKEHGLL